MSVKDLANETALLAPSVSRIIKHLNGKSYISTRRPEADQRAVLVSLTATGRRTTLDLGEEIHSHYAELTKRLDEGRLHQLLSLLHELETSASTL